MKELSYIEVITWICIGVYLILLVLFCSLIKKERDKYLRCPRCKSKETKLMESYIHRDLYRCDACNNLFTRERKVK